MSGGNVWVTGSRGLIGSRLATALADHGFLLTRITNTASDDDQVLQVDYRSRESLRAALKSAGVPSTCFHLGWGAMENPESPVHLGENLPNTQRLIDECFKKGLEKFIMVGSVDEYGSREGRLAEDAPPMGRLTKYAQSKMEACHYGFEAASKPGRVFLHVRLTHTLGVVKRQSSLINQLFKSYRESTPLGLSACDQFRDYIYVTDAVDGLMRIGELNSTEIVNLGSGTKIQLRDLVQRFWDKLGGAPELLEFGAHQRPANEPDQPPCYMSLDKLKAMTNWQPLVTIDEGISRTISELKAQS